MATRLGVFGEHLTVNESFDVDALLFVKLLNNASFQKRLLVGIACAILQRAWRLFSVPEIYFLTMKQARRERRRAPL